MDYTSNSNRQMYDKLSNDFLRKQLKIAILYICISEALVIPNLQGLQGVKEILMLQITQGNIILYKIIVVQKSEL